MLWPAAEHRSWSEAEAPAEAPERAWAHHPAEAPAQAAESAELRAQAQHCGEYPWKNQA